LLLCQGHAVLITVTLCDVLKSGVMMPPALFLLLRTALATCGLLHLHMNFVTDFSISVKNVIDVLMGIARI
jgi:hypothetical protein